MKVDVLCVCVCVCWHQWQKEQKRVIIIISLLIVLRKERERKKMWKIRWGCKRMSSSFAQLLVWWQQPWDSLHMVLNLVRRSTHHSPPVQQSSIRSTEEEGKGVSAMFPWVAPGGTWLWPSPSSVSLDIYTHTESLKKRKKRDEASLSISSKTVDHLSRVGAAKRKSICCEYKSTKTRRKHKGKPERL